MDALKAVGAFLSGKRGPTFEAFRGPSGKWFVREVASNGQTVNITESYASKNNAVRSAKRQASQVPNSKWKVVA
jgi:uncharacterized protein YegP (UPF0339 family)